MCYRTRRNIVCRRVRASFSPEILQAGAVKGLISESALPYSRGTRKEQVCRLWMPFPCRCVERRDKRYGMRVTSVSYCLACDQYIRVTSLSGLDVPKWLTGM